MATLKRSPVWCHGNISAHFRLWTKAQSYHGNRVSRCQQFSKVIRWEIRKDCPWVSSKTSFPPQSPWFKQVKFNIWSQRHVYLKSPVIREKQGLLSGLNCKRGHTTGSQKSDLVFLLLVKKVTTSAKCFRMRLLILNTVSLLVDWE